MVLTSRIALVFALVFATGCGEKAQDAADKAKEVAGAAGEKAKVAGEKAVDGAKKAMAGAQGGLIAIAAEALLAPVPADTPYVMANLAPLPADFQAKTAEFKQRLEQGATLDDLFVDNLRHAMSAEPDSAILVMPDGRRVNVLDVQKQALDDLLAIFDSKSAAANVGS